MQDLAVQSRRKFLRVAAMTVGPALLSQQLAQANEADVVNSESGLPDYTLHIGTSPIEIAPNRILSLTSYNDCPGPLLRFKEGRQVTGDVYNDTDVPEKLHWHGEKVPTDVNGASEEGTPYIPAHGKRRIAFIPTPAGLRFYHTHNRAGGQPFCRTIQWASGTRVH
jgi:FtsP/CotA-like multicopper oxidase with cupredoxin domain